MGFDARLIRKLPADEKIRSFNEMRLIIRRLNHAGFTVMLAQGVFDIIHKGHVGYLQAARRVDPANSVVIVGIENDESVKLNKGDKRPINTQGERMDVLAELMSTSLVFTYPDAPSYTKPQDYIKRYKALGPAAIVVPTWDPHRKLKEWQASEAGTKLAYVNYQHLNSTTRMLHAVGYE